MSILLEIQRAIGYKNYPKPAAGQQPPAPDSWLWTGWKKIGEDNLGDIISSAVEVVGFVLSNHISPQKPLPPNLDEETRQAIKNGEIWITTQMRHHFIFSSHLYTPKNLGFYETTDGGYGANWTPSTGTPRHHARFCHVQPTLNPELDKKMLSELHRAQRGGYKIKIRGEIEKLEVLSGDREDFWNGWDTSIRCPLIKIREIERTEDNSDEPV